MINFSNFIQYHHLVEAYKKGIKHEKNVSDMISNTSKIQHNLVVASSTAGSKADEPDIEVEYNGMKFKVELKLHSEAIFGSRHINFDAKDQSFSIGQKGVILQSVKELTTTLNNNTNAKKMFTKFIDAANAINSKHNVSTPQIEKMPFKINKQFVKDFGDYKKQYKIEVPISSSIIKNHYLEKKEVSYVDIGGSGLYHFGNDPMNLGVPEFNPQNAYCVINPDPKGQNPETFRLRIFYKISDLPKSKHSLLDINTLKKLFP